LIDDQCFIDEVFEMNIEAIACANAPERPAEVAPSLADFHAFRIHGCFSVKRRSALLNCVLQGLNARGLFLKTSIRPEIGDEIDAVFEQIGRLQGSTEEITDEGVFVSMPPALMKGLLDQVIWLQTAETQRRHLRIHPREPQTSIKLNGTHTAHPATLVNFSLSGASLKSDASVQLGDKVTFHNFTEGKVVWVAEGGCFGVEFQRPFRPTEFSWATRL